MLAWKSVRLHAAGKPQAERFRAVSERLRRVSLKAVIASATMTPFTQVLASCALAAVITAALWQSGRDQATVGGFVAFITAMLMTLPPIRHLADVMAPSPAAWRRSSAASTSWRIAGPRRAAASTRAVPRAGSSCAT